ncbi:hypothetical protein Nepgr_005096 [Nepenthes gracilis]|uniref:Uncharacterized protein n=1 Tax=Nepenthes gracilis TaxID=150966 RepID=A0AAD3S2U6_NEPGR|nr:hypothetical protein Nepgr_005096 [Nepenthes gracilis]
MLEDCLVNISRPFSSCNTASVSNLNPSSDMLLLARNSFESSSSPKEVDPWRGFASNPVQSGSKSDHKDEIPGASLAKAKGKNV